MRAIKRERRRGRRRPQSQLGRVPEPESQEEMKAREWARIQGRRQAFKQGIVQLRGLRPRASLDDLGRCLPYEVSAEEAPALARVLLALEDKQQVPSDVRKSLQRHLLAILRGEDGLLRRVGPPRPPGRPYLLPVVRKHVPPFYKELRRLCRASPTLTRHEIYQFFSQHLPHWSRKINDTRWQKLEGILRETKPHHEKAAAILGCVLASKSWAKKVIYEKEKKIKPRSRKGPRQRVSGNRASGLFSV